MTGELPTRAFSNAVRVIMSRGRIFFSRRLRSAGPTDLHSSNFSSDSAGKDDDPGRVIPRTSAAEAMVFAVYILNDYDSNDALSERIENPLLHKLRVQDMHV